MKQLNDVKTVDMLPNGAPAFDLDVERDDAWPMPAGGVWVPRPAAETAEREAMVRAQRPDPAEERNPIAAAFTRLLTWSQR